MVYLPSQHDKGDARGVLSLIHDHSKLDYTENFYLDKKKR
jgi:hypothetical protein